MFQTDWFFIITIIIQVWTKSIETLLITSNPENSDVDNSHIRTG